MKTYIKTIRVPQLEIRESYIEETLEEFLEENAALRCVVYSDNNKSIYNTEDRRAKMSGRGLVFNFRQGYGGDIYLECNGYPLAWGQGYSSGRIRVYKEGGVSDEEVRHLLTKAIEWANNGVRYDYVLHDEQGCAIDEGVAYDLEDIAAALPAGWIDERLDEYVINSIYN